MLSLNHWIYTSCKCTQLFINTCPYPNIEFPTNLIMILKFIENVYFRLNSNIIEDDALVLCSRSTNLP